MTEIKNLLEFSPLSKLNFKEDVPVREHYDIIVAGGGVAGVAAALSARRAGKNVLLIEKSVTLGGLATIGLINFFVPMCNGRGKLIIRGMAEELLRLAIRYGYDSIPKDWKNGEPTKPTLQRYCTRYSPQIFALAMTELLHDTGITIRFDSVVSAPVMNGSHCEGVIVESKSGREYFSAGIVVDTTGDADVLYRAKVPTRQGENYFTYYGHALTLESCRLAWEGKNIAKAITGRHGGKANLYGKNHPSDMPFYSGTNADEISQFLVLNQCKMLDDIRTEERTSRDIITLPAMCQFRTTRCIDGDYCLTVNDQYQHFSDSVGAINDFDQRDFLYEIPYRALVRSGFDNLVTAGRSACSEGYAWDILRGIPSAIISAQAAGTAAALALDSGSPIYDINIPTLQQSLKNADVMIHFDDALVPTCTATDIKVDSNHF